MWSWLGLGPKPDTACAKATHQAYSYVSKDDARKHHSTKLRSKSWTLSFTAYRSTQHTLSGVAPLQEVPAAACRFAEGVGQAEPCLASKWTSEQRPSYGPDGAQFFLAV